jgi:hypothetical protein
MIGLNSSFLFDEMLEVLLLLVTAEEEAAPRLTLLLLLLLFDAASLLRKKEPKQSVAEPLLRCKLCIDCCCCNMLTVDDELRHDLSVKSVPVRRSGGNGVSAADAENSSLCSLTRSCCDDER